MDDTVIKMYKAANSQNNVYPKALANFLFREIIEDVHSKYNKFFLLQFGKERDIIGLLRIIICWITLFLVIA